MLILQFAPKLLQTAPNLGYAIKIWKANLLM